MRTLIAILLCVAGQAQAVPVCETVAWPVYGEAHSPDHIYRATAGGLEVTERDSGTSRLLTTCDGLPSTHVLAVTAYGDGAVLAVRGGGLWRLSPGGKVTPVGPSEPLRWATAVASLGDDLVVGTVSDGVVRLVPDGAGWRLTRPWPKWSKGRTTALLASEDGLWVGRDQQGLWTLDARGRERRVLRGSVQGLSKTPEGLLVDRGIEVCVARGNRCTVSEAPVSVAPPAGQLPSNHVTALAVYPGPEGAPALWAGTFDQGVVVRVGERWERPDAVGEAPRFVNQVVAAPDALWVATSTGAYRLQDGRWTRYGEPAGLLTDRVNGLSVDDGRVWFATSQGLSVWGERGISTVTQRDGLPHRIVHAITSWDGAVYAGTSDGLAVIRDGQVTVLRTEAGAISANWITALLATPDGVLSGTYDRGVDHLTGPRPTPLEGLGPVWVNPHGVWQDPADGTLYVATLGEGLWHGEGAAWSRVQAPLPSNDVTAVARLDGLWVATREGLLHLSEL